MAPQPSPTSAAVPGAESALPASSTSASTPNRQTRFRFSDDDDVLLLRQVVGDQPFAASFGQKGTAWNRVAASINGVIRGSVDGRACKDRTDKLLAQHSRSQRESLRQSGVNEPYTEKVQLLDHLAELVDGHTAQVRAATAAQQANAAQDELEARQLMTASMQGLATPPPVTSPAGAVSDIALPGDASSWSTNAHADQVAASSGGSRGSRGRRGRPRHARDYALFDRFYEQNQDILDRRWQADRELQERELQLNQERLDFERESRKQDTEAARRRDEHITQLIQQQQQLINVILSKILDR